MNPTNDTELLDQMLEIKAQQEHLADLYDQLKQRWIDTHGIGTTTNGDH